jgi:hypothetical protein
LTYNIYDRGIFIFYLRYDPVFWYFSEHSCTWNVNYLICMQYFHNWTANMQYLTTTSYYIYLLLFSFSKQYLTTAAYWLLFTFYVFQAGSEQPVICSRWWQEGKFHVLWNIHKEYNVSVVCLTISTQVDVCSLLTPLRRFSISIMVLYDTMLTLLLFVFHVTVPGYSHLTRSLGRQYCNTPRRDMILSSVSYQPKKESATHFTRKIVWHWHWTLALAARVVLQYSRIESMC